MGKLTVHLSIGAGITFETSEGNDKEVFAQAAFWHELAAAYNKCGLCGSTDVRLYHRSPQGNDYFGVHCNACTAEVNVSQHKNTPTFFIKKDTQWSIWDGKSSSQNQNQNQNQGQPPQYSAPPQYNPPQGNAAAPAPQNPYINPQGNGNR